MKGGKDVVRKRGSSPSPGEGCSFLPSPCSSFVKRPVLRCETQMGEHTVLVMAGEELGLLQGVTVFCFIFYLILVYFAILTEDMFE